MYKIVYYYFSMLPKRLYKVVWNEKDTFKHRPFVKRN